MIMPRHVYLFSMKNYTSMHWSGPLCYLYDFMVETLPQMFHSISNLLTLGKEVSFFI